MDSRIKSGVRKRVAQVLFTVVLLAVILFASSGQFDWLWAWVFLGLYGIGIVLIGSYLFNFSPATIALRAEASPVQRWDRVVTTLWSVCFFAIPLVAGLHERYAWTLELALGWHLLGAALFSLGLALFGWAMIVNTYFSTVVRVLPGNQHQVTDRGPYSLVRHPGYLGALFMALGIPLLLGSVWALLPGAAAIVFLAIRTLLEDRFLHERLPGYTQYAARVRYRLLPGVW